MTPLLLIHTTSMHVQRIADNTISKAYQIAPDATRQDIERFRIHGAPAPLPPTPAERAFAAMGQQLAG